MSRFYQNWCRAFDALQPLKKEQYYPEDIRAIEEAATGLLQEFMREGYYTYNNMMERRVVKGIKIEYEAVSEQVRYVDKQTIKIKLIV